jgi:hypothetical protein
MPLTRPVLALTLAVEVDELFHVPPAGPLAKAVVAPTQTTCVPLIAVGNTLTVNDVVT